MMVAATAAAAGKIQHRRLQCPPCFEHSVGLCLTFYSIVLFNFFFFSYGGGYGGGSYDRRGGGGYDDRRGGG